MGTNIIYSPMSSSSLKIYGKTIFTPPLAAANWLVFKQWSSPIGCQSGGADRCGFWLVGSLAAKLLKWKLAAKFRSVFGENIVLRYFCCGFFSWWSYSIIHNRAPRLQLTWSASKNIMHLKTTIYMCNVYIYIRVHDFKF